MGSRGNYEKSTVDSIIEKEREKDIERTITYIGSNVGIFYAPRKCPKCKGKLSLIRKFECYEFLVCAKCKTRYKRNVFKQDAEMEEFHYGAKSN